MERLARGEVGRAPAPRDGERGWARSPAELVAPGLSLAETFRRIPTGRLVLLGEAGAGKTTLVIGFVLALLAKRRDSDPVPVVVTAHGWQPSDQTFVEWMRDRLYRDYPFLSIKTEGDAARLDVLLDKGLLLPVVDGWTSWVIADVRTRSESSMST